MIDRTQAGRFIGGIGLTHLRVFDTRPAPDGQMSGCAHIHGVTDEGYYVIGGSGRLELHDIDNGFRNVPLTKGRYVQFTPGTLHRTVSEDSLEILVIMGNAGMAEHGDARIYFGQAVDEDRVEYARLTNLARERGLEGALERRDVSVAAYSELVRLWEHDRQAYGNEIGRFLAVHLQELARGSDQLTEIVDSSLGHWHRVTTDRVAALETGIDPAQSFSADQQSGGPKFGMCGILHQIQDFNAV